MAERKRLLLFLSLVVCAAAYARTASYEFVYDDRSLIAENPRIRDVGKIPEMLLKEDWIDEIHVGFYRPLFLASLAADYRLWGADPFGFHLCNIILHLIVVALVFLLSLKFFGDPAAAFVSSLFFGIHPVNTEAVTFLSARNNLLCAIFVVFSFLAGPGFGSLTGTETARRGNGRLALSLIFFFLGLLSKETAIMLPFVLVAAGRRPGRARIAVYAPYFAVLAVYFVLRRMALAGFLGIDIRAAELDDRLVGMLTALASYVRLSFLPLGQKALYDVSTAFSAKTLVSVLALLAIAAALIKHRGKTWVTFPAVWFFGFLIPAMNIVPIAGSMMAERYLYIPLIGGSVLAGGLYSSLSGRSLPGSGRRYAKAAFGLVLTAFAVLTVMRTPVWKNDEALYSDMIKTTPTSYKGHYNLGNIRFREGRLKEAERLWCKAVEVRPDMYAVRNNLGVLYEKTGDYEKAEAQYRAILGVRSIPEVYRNLGNALRGQKRFSEAQEAYERAIAMSPGGLEAYVGLTEIYEETGRPELALRAMEGAIKNMPGSYMAYNIAGTVLGKMGRYEEAGRYFAKSLEINPACYECGYNMELIKGMSSGRR